MGDLIIQLSSASATGLWYQHRLAEHSVARPLSQHVRILMIVLLIALNIYVALKYKYCGVSVVLHNIAFQRNGLEVRNVMLG